MDVKEKLKLIKKNTQEIITEEELTKLLKSKKKPHAYVGAAPTGKIHIGYFLPVLKIRDLMDAGFDFTFLAADLHAHLDDLKSPWELLDARSDYYIEVIKAMLDAVGGHSSKLKTIKGSEFQLEKEYTQDVLRMAATTTLSRAKRAAAEIVRFGDEPKLGGFVYPLMQAEDVHALKADVTLGGLDQRGTYMFARDVLPEIGHKKPISIFTPLMPGLTGGKMSASVPASKIDVLDSEKEVAKKMNKAFCPEKKVEGNGVLAYTKHIIFEIVDKIEINRPEKFGGNVVYNSYKELEKDFVSGKLHPLDLKKALGIEVNKLLDVVRKYFKNKSEIVEKAYP